MNDEGWYWPINAGKAHYYRGSRSLCGKWAVLVIPELQPDKFASPNDCKGCRAKLEKEKSVTTLPPRNEARRVGLEILSLYLYDGPVAAAERLSSLDDPGMVYAVSCYYLKSLSEYVQFVADERDGDVANVLQMMGQRILATDDEENPE